MSGSPIIQNNYIIGAVTHVVVDDPSKGYGISIIKMLKAEDNSHKALSRSIPTFIFIVN